MLIIWALVVTLTLKIANQSVCMTLRLTMKHHNKFGSQYVWQVNRSLFILDKHSLTFWTYTVPLTLNAVILFFFSKDTLVYDDVSSQQVWLPKNQQFSGYNRKSHMIIWALAVTLILKKANNLFHMMLWLWCCITIPSLVTKRSAVQKIPGQTFTIILNLHCDLDLECSNQIFPQGTPAYDAVLLNQVWLQQTCSLEDIVATVIVWLYKPFSATLLLKTVNQCSCMKLHTPPHINAAQY